MILTVILVETKKQTSHPESSHLIATSASLTDLWEANCPSLTAGSALFMQTCVADGCLYVGDFGSDYYFVDFAFEGFQPLWWGDWHYWTDEERLQQAVASIGCECQGLWRDPLSVVEQRVGLQLDRNTVETTVPQELATEPTRRVWKYHMSLLLMLQVNLRNNNNQEESSYPQKIALRIMQNLWLYTNVLWIERSALSLFHKVNNNHNTCVVIFNFKCAHKWVIETSQEQHEIVTAVSHNSIIKSYLLLPICAR